MSYRFKTIKLIAFALATIGIFLCGYYNEQLGKHFLNQQSLIGLLCVNCSLLFIFILYLRDKALKEKIRYNSLYSEKSNLEWDNRELKTKVCQLEKRKTKTNKP